VKIAVRPLSAHDKARLAEAAADPWVSYHRGLCHGFEHWPHSWHSGNVCIAEDGNHLIVQVPHHPTAEGGPEYLVLMDGSLAGLQWCTSAYAFTFVAPDLWKRLDEIRAFAWQALQVPDLHWQGLYLAAVPVFERVRPELVTKPEEDDQFLRGLDPDYPPRTSI
jgi:hypothetical protein